jgi:hypothetical protein
MTDKQEAALELVKDLMRRVSHRRQPSGDYGGRVFWSRGRGGLSLDKSTALMFARVRDRLVDAFAAPERFELLGEPPKFVEKLLQTALLEAEGAASTKSRERRGVGAPRREQRALAKLHRELVAPQPSWTAWVRIESAEPLSRPVTVGGVTFRSANSGQLAEMRARITALNPGSNRSKKWATEQRTIRRREATRFLADFDHSAHIVARVAVLAPDSSIAESRALARIRVVVDVLNFFAGGHRSSYKDTALKLAPVPNGHVPCLLATSDQVTWTAEHFDCSPLALSELAREKQFAHVRALLRPDGATALQQRLITAAAWAGRARQEHRPDQAFVMMMVALEAARSGPGERSGSTQRICQRAAHLVGRGQEGRLATFDLAKDLYQVRSELVHEGTSSGLTKSALRSLSALVRAIIRRLVWSLPFRAMKTPRDLEQWFHRQLLAQAGGG